VGRPPLSHIQKNCSLFWESLSGPSPSFPVLHVICHSPESHEVLIFQAFEPGELKVVLFIG
jgi:hypothetical protein